MEILHTSVLHFAPSIKLHHLVVLSKPTLKNQVYTVDFSPINQTDIKTMFRLLFAQNVPAEIRIRHIENIDISDSGRIIQMWSDMNHGKSEEKSNELSIETIQKIRDREVKTVIQQMRENPEKMNLYRYNCQHFGKKILSLYSK